MERHEIVAKIDRLENAFIELCRSGGSAADKATLKSSITELYAAL